MIVALALIIVVLVSTAAIGHQLEKAPEGFEDHTGFHFIARDSGSSLANVRGATTVVLVGRDEGAPVPSLP